jgi:UDP-N-acetyl-D-glucosamine dehydrogenase
MLKPKTIAIIGQGYVGLPLSLAASISGYKVYGIDTNEFKVQKLARGISGLEGIDDSKLQSAIASRSYFPTTDYSKVSECEIVVICVPTPLTSDKQPDLSLVVMAAKAISTYLKVNSLVILESTVSPGTTREVLVNHLANSGENTTENFHVAYSPERIDPLNKEWNVSNTPKLVAGMTKKASKLAVEFYSQFVESVIEVESIEVVETAKLLENAFRLVNISFINEMAVFCNKLGINISEVIESAATKPFGFMPFYPSIGVGGHCIPVDPVYLADKANEIGAPIRSIEVALKVNSEMVGFAVSRAEKLLTNLSNKKILVVGVAYKANVSDMRESPAKQLIFDLRTKGASVSWHDEIVKNWEGEVSVDISTGFDLAIIATIHDGLDLSKLGNTQVIDTRNSV